MRPFDNTGAFLPVQNLNSEIRDRAVRGAGVTLLSGFVSLVFQMVSTVVLARLVSSTAFGVVTAATTFSLLLVNFGLNGFTEAIIQREEINHQLISNIFWINLGAGLVLTLGFASAAGLLAKFFANPHVGPVAVAVSVTIVITSASVQHLALLKRAMAFSIVSANDIGSRIVSVVVSIVLAWMGWGYWALAIGVIAGSVSTTAGAWYFCRWLPGRPRPVAGTQSIVRFALHTYGRFGVNYFARNMDNVLVGWRFDVQSLGFYKRAYDLFAFSAGAIVSPLTVVVVAALSRLNNDSAQYRKSLLGALGVVSFVGMGLGTALTLVGYDVIALILGPGWEQAGRIFTFFGPGIGVMMLYYTNGWIHLSIGRADRWFRWSIVELIVTGLLFVLGLRWGPAGVAVAWTASFWLLCIPGIWYAGRPINFGIGPVLRVVWKYVLASGLAGLAIFETPQRLRFFLASSSSVSGPVALAIRIGTVCAEFGILYLVGVILLSRGFGPLREILTLLRHMLPSSKIAARPADTVSAIDVEAIRQRENRNGASLSKPLVSILIPAYNAQEWIAGTIRSALAQTWERIEIIVVDDGSSDRTLAIARQFESDVVRIVSQENLGAAMARNKALSLSSGDYIQWLDADDLLAPDKIALQMAVLGSERDKRTLLSSEWGRFMYRQSKARFLPTALWCDLEPAEWLLRKLEQNVFMQTATWLVSRELTEAAGPWDSSLLGDDDGEYFCRVLLASDGVRFVRGAKVYYRGPGIAFGTLSYIARSDRKLEAHWRSMKLHIDCMRSMDDSKRSRAACTRYLQNWLSVFYPDRLDIVGRAQEVARSMETQLHPPHLSWKYSWVRTVCGWNMAMRLGELLPKIRWHIQSSWDKALFRLGGGDAHQLAVVVTKEAGEPVAQGKPV